MTQEMIHTACRLLPFELHISSELHVGRDVPGLTATELINLTSVLSSWTTLLGIRHRSKQTARAESISFENTQILITHMYRRCVIELRRWTPLTGAGSRQTSGWPWVRLQGLRLILSSTLSITGLQWLVANFGYSHLVNTYKWQTQYCETVLLKWILFQCALYLQYRSPITLCGQGTSTLYTLQWNTSGGWSPPRWNFEL